MHYKFINHRYNKRWDILLPEQRAKALSDYRYGWETRRLSHMYKNILTGSLIYDIGAECGDMSALYASWGHEVAIFEPNPANWLEIKETFIANDLKEPDFWSGFVSDESASNGEQVLWDDIEDYEVIGQHGFKELHNEREYYPQITLDDWVQDHRPPDVLTIDVEGSEYQVIDGARQVLAEHKPQIYLSLHPEFMMSHWNIHSNELRSVIKSFGYRETLIDYKHEVHLYYE